MIKELKNRFKTMCVSYTITTIIFLFLSLLNIASEINNYALFCLLILNFVIAVLMFFTDRLKTNRKYISLFIDLLDIFTVVFLLGGLVFKLFAFRFNLILTVSIMNVLIYSGVFFIITYRNLRDAEMINKKLKSRRDEK